MASADIRHGLVVLDDGDLVVNVDGALYRSPWWASAYTPAAGDPVVVALHGGEATVLAPAVVTPRPATGTVSGSPVDGAVNVIGTNGVTYSCRYVGTAPADSTEVLLLWQGTQAWLIDDAASYTPPEPDPDEPDPAPTPPPEPESGTLLVGAVDSGYFTNIWLGSELRQGSYGSYTYKGAWFYGSRPAQLAGATITSVRLRLGPRLRIGNYNSSLSLNVQRITNKTKPGRYTAPNFTGSSDSHSIPSNAGARWVTLPDAMGQALVDAGGGGIGIQSGSYGGVEGLGDYAASGQLELKWTR